MLGKFATKSHSRVIVGQSSSTPLTTKKSGEWKLERMPLQEGPKEPVLKIRLPQPLHFGFGPS